VEHYDDCAPGGLNCPQRVRGDFDRSLRDGEAIWPVCERAPVGDGEINLTFMRLPWMEGVVGNYEAVKLCKIVNLSILYKMYIL